MRAFELETNRRAQIGLVVLRTDETIEHDMRRLMPDGVELLVSRVQSDGIVTGETLAAMEGDLGRAAELFPPAARFASMGYGCTSGTAQIGAARIETLLRDVSGAKAVTNPVTALVAACRAMEVGRLAIVSPYIAPVAKTLCDVLKREGLETPAVTSFDVADEATVVRIAGASITRAACTVAKGADVDAIFLSCTNLRTLDVIAGIEDATGLSVISSNTALAWHMLKLAGVPAPPSAPGRLFTV